MTAAIQKYYSDISVGMSTTCEKQITHDDVQAFANISRDHNPLHLDDEFARNTIFGERIAHGMLTASYIPAAMITLTGPGWIYINQSLEFRAPVKIGEIVTTYVEVKKCIPEKNFVELITECSVKGTIVIKGMATVKSPD